jgi:hypothetical protein
MRTTARAALISLVVLVCILAVNILIFSPWHRHNVFSKQLCAFSAFEHGNGTEAPAAIQIVPPTFVVWLPANPDPAPRTLDIRVHCAGRAPPA